MAFARATRTPDRRLSLFLGVQASSLLRPGFVLLAFSIGIGCLHENRVLASELSDAHELLRSGKYDECLQLTEAAIAKETWNETWRHLQLEAQMARGKYKEALATFQTAQKKYGNSIRLAERGVQVYRLNNQATRAANLLEQIEQMALRSPWRYSDSANLVSVGRSFQMTGVDARQVLKVFFVRAKARSPKFVEAYLAAGELALEKHDYLLASKEFQQAIQIDPTNAQSHYLKARAFAPSEWSKAKEALQKSLELNPNHVESLLLLVDHAIDAEGYSKAESLLERVAKINPHHPRAWSYSAVIATLKNKPQRAEAARKKALAPWETNPAVEHLIGRKLSQKYRFAEGADHQRSALKYDSRYLPARIQLAQDLLRLGEEDRGWQLASEVSRTDEYNIVAHNLMSLHDRISKFKTLERDDIVLRMEAREADLYGTAVLDLLTEAREVLCEKYDVQPEKKILVEIFPRQEDFAIRTFGLPGGAGYLGVCFGRVITANSPASQGASPSNWQAVLWHEFCHVVTLEKTSNKMPRWLSEGISVYEERKKNASWGQHMDPTFREMILGEDLTPVSKLSSAFLSPQSAGHLQFAYYESSLVVEYLIEKHGHDTLKRILTDLGVGMPINDALNRYTGSLEQLDEDFAEYALKKAKALATELEFTKPELQRNSSLAQISAWIATHPNNFFALRMQAGAFMKAKEWARAKKPLQRLLDAYPDYVGAANAYQMLAECHKQLDESGERIKVLDRLAHRSSDSCDAYSALIDAFTKAKDWKNVEVNADRLLAVDPLRRTGHAAKAESAFQQGNSGAAITSFESLLRFETTDFAETHLRLGKLYRGQGDLSKAKRHALQAIEEAPRFRTAYKLLLELKADEQSEASEDLNASSSDESPQISEEPVQQ